MSNKKWLICSIIGLWLLAAITGCSNGSQSKQVEGKVNVVTSFYPLYYFAKEIGGDQAHVVNLVAAGVEPHDWTPKSRDLDAVSNAQLFLYNGAGLEGWVDDFLNGLGTDSKVVTVETSKGIELIKGNPEEVHEEEVHEEEVHEEEVHEEEEHAGEVHEEEEGHGHSELDVDPHTWVSPRSALIMAANIRDAFVAADPGHQADFESRYVDLENRLKQLDEKFAAGLADYERRDIVVSHQAFGYLCRDYKLNQIAIMGLSPDAEPRSQDLLKIADYVKKSNISYIFFEELVSDRLAETLASEANVDTLVLNPLEGLTPEQEKAGETYITLMERNLVNLQKALQ
ncbi:metal ABC transporter solute-binding protein, Zn/Mn family [Cohnella sp.]|uniref:metal ABC transporter solute-binding protein, Zn/Mn family n=1 Tax=Cohnella sp. TaxID=1883426 RepID=UPI003563D480